MAEVFAREGVPLVRASSARVQGWMQVKEALRVRGDSMINAGILSGDKVVVRPQQSADDGQIVVARIGDEATVKRLRRRHGEVWLMPENDNYSPIDGTEAEIIGIVKAVVREY